MKHEQKNKNVAYTSSPQQALIISATESQLSPSRMSGASIGQPHPSNVISASRVIPSRNKGGGCAPGIAARIHRFSVGVPR